MMTLPGLILGALLGALVGGILHLAVGGHLGRLILYLLLGIAGFWLGQFVAEVSGWLFLSFGTLHLGMAIPGSLLVSGMGYWLSLVQTTRKPG